MPNGPTTWRYAETFPFLERIAAGMPPAIVSVAANGAVRGPESSPHLPETVDALTASVGDAYDAGASIVHLHARDPDRLWRGATNPDHWYELHRSIRARCPDVIIMDSTEGDPGMSYEERTACLEAAPEVASFTLAPEMRRIRVPERPPPHPRPPWSTEAPVDVSWGGVERLARDLLDRGIKAELEVKSAGGVQVVRHLVDRGLLTVPYMVQTVMGYPAGNYPTVQSVLDLLRDLPDDSLWLCLGKGRAQRPMLALALLMGGHVRVGLEDNLELEPGRPGTNAQFVERAVEMAAAVGRDVASPAEARSMLGLSSEPSTYP